MADLRAKLAARDPAATNPFLLLAAARDGEALWAASADGLSPRDVESPVFALGNELPDVDPGHRARTLGDRVQELTTDDPDALSTGLAARLAHHADDRGPRTSVCVHTDRGYGTVSSQIVLLGHERTDDHLWAAAGPPCTAEFVARHELLRTLTV